MAGDVSPVAMFLSIVISPGPYIEQDEEEGIKEEEGWRRLVPSVAFGWLLPVSSHTAMRGNSAAVRTMPVARVAPLMYCLSQFSTPFYAMLS